MSYFEDLTNGKIREGGAIKKHMNFLESLDMVNEPTIFYCYQLLKNELDKLANEYAKRTYKITENISPIEEGEVHVPKEFIILMDAEEISGSTKLYAHQILIMLNDYYRYLNKYSILKNKYIGHRKDIHKLNPDIELPKTQREVLQIFEDSTKKSDPNGYSYFLNALGVQRSPKRTAYEKLVKELSDPKYIKDRIK